MGEVCPTSGVLVLDDLVLDKRYALKMDLVHHMWSGKQHAVVKGIDVLMLFWTDGGRHLSCDYRILRQAKRRFFRKPPELSGRTLGSGARRQLRKSYI